MCLIVRRSFHLSLVGSTWKKETERKRNREGGRKEQERGRKEAEGWMRRSNASLQGELFTRSCFPFGEFNDPPVFTRWSIIQSGGRREKKRKKKSTRILDRRGKHEGQHDRNNRRARRATRIPSQIRGQIRCPCSWWSHVRFYLFSKLSLHFFHLLRSFSPRIAST